MIPSPEVVTALKGLEGDGREVERVTLAFDKSSACTAPVVM